MQGSLSSCCFRMAGLGVLSRLPGLSVEPPERKETHLSSLKVRAVKQDSAAILAVHAVVCLHVGFACREPLHWTDAQHFCSTNQAHGASPESGRVLWSQEVGPWACQLFEASCYWVVTAPAPYPEPRCGLGAETTRLGLAGRCTP